MSEGACAVIRWLSCPFASLTFSTFSFLPAILLALVVSVGCQGPPDGSEAVNQPDAPEAAEPPEKETPEPNELAEETNGADTPSEKDEAISPDEQTRESRERFMLLAPGGPLIVDLLLTVDGQTHEAALQTHIEQELLAADTNRDGRATWREVANSPNFRYGLLAYNPADMIRIYDADRDGLVGHHELLRYLTQNVGPWKSFVLHSSHQIRDSDRSPLRDLVDENRDGSVSREEMERGTTRLATFDSDDDGVVSEAELVPDAIQPPRTLALRRRTDRPEVAFRIYDRTKWEYVHYSLAEVYALGGELAVADFPRTPDLARALDADGNGTLVAEEIRQMASAEPHIVMRAVFWESGGDGEPVPTELSLDPVSHDFVSAETIVQPSPKRVMLGLPGLEIQFFINEDPMLHYSTTDAIDTDDDGRVSEYEVNQYMNRKQTVYRGLIRGRAADRQDRWFAAIDDNGDGQLNVREIREAPDRLAALDQNGDGEVRFNEVPCSIVVGFVGGNPGQDNELFALAPPPNKDDPKLPRWFTGMDSNEDGEISSREFLGTPDQFHDLDDNSDGAIELDEV